MRIVITVVADPDFYPKQLDIPALPPLGTTVWIGRDRFVMAELDLVAEANGDGAHYAATLIRST